MIDPTRRTLLGFLAAVEWGYGQSNIASDAEWKAYAGWISAIPPESFPRSGPAVLAAYRKKLMDDGISPANADQVIAGLREYQVKHPGVPEVLFYNKIYERKDPVLFTALPNAFLAETIEGLAPGNALDLGMGEGRNSIFLAQHRWAVTGIDLAEVGVAKARKQAEALGISIRALTQDANLFDFGSKRWDLVCLLYFEGYNYVHDIEKRIADGLKPGGLVINEGPQSTPQAGFDRWRIWEPLGFDLLRLEYRSHVKSDWGQPSFGRMLIQKRMA